MIRMDSFCLPLCKAVPMDTLLKVCLALIRREPAVFTVVQVTLALRHTLTAMRLLTRT